MRREAPVICDDEQRQRQDTFVIPDSRRTIGPSRCTNAIAPRTSDAMAFAF